MTSSKRDPGGCFVSLDKQRLKFRFFVGVINEPFQIADGTGRKFFREKQVKKFAREIYLRIYIRT
jgi:hypothetical protein